jgi:hypothetical protein
MQVLVLSAAAEREPRFDLDLVALRNHLNYARLQSAPRLQWAKQKSVAIARRSVMGNHGYRDDVANDDDDEQLRPKERHPRSLVEDDASERSLYALFRVQNAEAILQRVAAI